MELQLCECIDISIYDVRGWIMNIRLDRLHEVNSWTLEVRVYRWIDILGAILDSKCTSVSIYRYTSGMLNAECTSVSITWGALWNSKMCECIEVSIHKARSVECIDRRGKIAATFPLRVQKYLTNKTLNTWPSWNYLRGVHRSASLQLCDWKLACQVSVVQSLLG